MNSTTAHNRVTPGRILLISVLLQAAGLLVFYFTEPLRKSVLTPAEAPQEAQARDRAAAARLRTLEEQRQQQREKTALKRDDAQKLARQMEREKAAPILDQLRDMEKIREELKRDAATVLDQLAERSVEDVSRYLFDRLHPLSTQLVVSAEQQQAQADLEAGPAVQASARSLLDFAERERARLMEPAVFERLRATHDEVSKAQRRYIDQLDQAQAAYTGDLDRIRRENHMEYQVNLRRDQIAGLLGEAAELEVATMNDLPPEVAALAELPVESTHALDDLSVPELHDQAQSLFEDIRQLFSGARAASMAMEQHTSMTGAFQAIQVPGPTPAFQPGDGPAAPQTVGELNQYATHLGQAARDVGQLWQQAHNMGVAGRSMTGRAGPGGPEGSGTPSAAAHGNGRGRGTGGVGAARAAEGRAGRYADMTPFMYASGGEGGVQGFGSGHGGGRDITTGSLRSGYRETGSGTPGARAPLLSEDKVIKEALPGRMFNRDSPRTGWLYLDTWYVIGPWENRSRVGHEQAWPPETLVDLDATYEGKRGQKLVWQFHQSDNIRVKPPAEDESSTYYAYTEVYFEEETEMLIAVASDDAAKVWLNDQLIWRDNGIGPWRLDEGFRKVVFKKGFNTLLVRIENGPVTCTYSILLCPPEILI